MGSTHYTDGIGYVPSGSDLLAVGISKTTKRERDRTTEKKEKGEWERELNRERDETCTDCIWYAPQGTGRWEVGMARNKSGILNYHSKLNY